MRALFLIVLSGVVVVAGTASAQNVAAKGEGSVGGGVTVRGWRGRVDPSVERQGHKLDEVSFADADADSAWRVSSGPAAIYWSPSNRASGTYTVAASFTQTKATEHPEFYGIFIGGTDLGGTSMNYLYCLVSGTGVFLVKHRIGDEIHDLAARTQHASIVRVDASGRATNEVGWRVTPERTSCVVNGKEVWGYASSNLIGPGKLETLNGIAGIRVNHHLDLEIRGFGIEKR